jgi:hypothetical protein
MSFSFFTIQYMHDPFRREGINIAVIASIDGRGYARAPDLPACSELHDFDAFSNGTAEFRALTGLSYSECAAYPDLLDYLASVGVEYGVNDERLAAEMRCLAESVCALVPVTQGIETLKRGEKAEDAVERVFRELVGPIPKRRLDHFPDLVARVLHHAELGYNDDLHVDACVDLTAGTEDPAVSLDFDYAVIADWVFDRGVVRELASGKSRRPNAGLRVVGGRMPAAQRRARLDAALVTFEQAIRLDFMEPEHLALLTDAHGVDEALGRCNNLGIRCIDAAASDAGNLIHDVMTA